MQRKEKKRRTAPGNEIEKLRRKAREFSGVETLLEGLELIDFVLKARGTNAVF